MAEEIENEEIVSTNPEQDTEEVAVKEKVQEKMLPQSEVGRVVNREKREAYERGKREAMEEMKRQQQQQQAAPTMGGMEQMTPERVQQLIEEQAQKQSELQMAQKIANEFIGKLQASKPKYEDFDEVVAELNLPSVPQLVSWTNSLDNTGDVVYDIAKNPSKFANILILAQTSPELAQRELRKLSDSIKRNEAAKEQDSSASPLNQLKPSNLGNGDTGSMSVADLRQMPWLRG